VGKFLRTLQLPHPRTCYPSAMPRFIFIRHATSENNTVSTLSGKKKAYPNVAESAYVPTEAHVDTRPLLSTVLDAQAATGTIRMYVSPLIRTWQTALLLCKTRLLKRTRTGLRLELRIGPHLKEAISFANQWTGGIGNNPASLEESVKAFNLFVVHLGLDAHRVSLYLGHTSSVDVLTKVTVGKALPSTLCTQFAQPQYTRDGDLQRFVDTCTRRSKLDADAPVLVVAHSKLMRNYVSAQISGENCGCLVTDGDGRGNVQYVRGYAKVSGTKSKVHKRAAASSRRKRRRSRSSARTKGRVTHS